MQRFVFKYYVFLSFLIGYAQAQTLTFKDALKVASTQNPRLKAALYSVQIIRADSTTAALRPNPSFHNETMQTVNNDNLAPHTAWLDGLNRQTMFTLTKPFQLAGQRQKKIDLASKNINVANKDYFNLERQVLTDVANKWMEVYTAHKELEMISIAKNNIDSLSAINQVRLNNQVITQTDYMRTQLLANEYHLKQKNAQQKLNNKLKELAYLLGNPDFKDIDLQDEFVVNVHIDNDSLLQKLVNQRSDIQTAQSSIKAANSNIALQKSLAIPIPEFGIMWNPQNSINYIGFTMTFDLPLFSRNQGEIKKAYAQKSQNEATYQAVKDKAVTEIQTAYASYLTQKENTKQYTDSLLQQSQDILNNVQYAYLKGGTSLIDLLEAQRSWLDTQQQYYESLQNYRESYIQLLYATGLINQIIL